MALTEPCTGFVLVRVGRTVSCGAGMRGGQAASVSNRHSALCVIHTTKGDWSGYGDGLTLVILGKPHLGGVLAQEAFGALHLLSRSSLGLQQSVWLAYSHLGCFSIVSALFLHALQTNMSWSGRENREKWERFVVRSSSGQRQEELEDQKDQEKDQKQLPRP